MTNQDANHGFLEPTVAVRRFDGRPWMPHKEERILSALRLRVATVNPIATESEDKLYAKTCR